MTHPKTFALLWALWIITVTAVSGQEPLRGRVMTADGEPVSGVSVSLHRVTPEGAGAEVASSTSGPDGRWALSIEEPEAGGVLFGVAEYEGTLYLGAPFESFGQLDGEYRIVVGQGGTSVGPMEAGPSAPAPSPPSRDSDLAAGLILVGTLAVLALGLLVWMLRAHWVKVPPRRRALAELAAIEEALSAASEPETTHERLRQRAEAIRNDLVQTDA